MNVVQVGRPVADNTNVVQFKRDLLTTNPQANEPQPHPGRRPTIKLTIKEHECNDLAIEALTRDQGVYQRGGKLVRIRQEATKRGGIERFGSPTIAPIPPATIREVLTKHGAFWKFS